MKPQSVSPSVRLRELLAIADRERTDAQWDELSQLEIMLAPKNQERATQEMTQPGAPAAYFSSEEPARGSRPVTKPKRRIPRGRKGNTRS